MLCVFGTISSFLEGSRKVIYLWYMCLLAEGHRYQSKKFYNFYGMSELHSATVIKQDGHYIFAMVQTIQITYGKY